MSPQTKCRRDVFGSFNFFYLIYMLATTDWYLANHYQNIKTGAVPWSLSPIGQTPTIIDCQSRCFPAQPYHMKDQEEQDDQDNQDDEEDEEDEEDEDEDEK